MGSEGGKKENGAVPEGCSLTVLPNATNLCTYVVSCLLSIFQMSEGLDPSHCPPKAAGSGCLCEVLPKLTPKQLNCTEKDSAPDTLNIPGSVGWRGTT